MKRICTIALVAMLSVPLLNAQESMFNMGDKVVNLGIGLGSTYGLYRSLGYSTGVPPVSISYEQAFMDEILDEGVIGIGGYLGYSSYKYRYVFADYGWNYSNIILAALGTFHYPLVDKLDTYAGVLGGYRISIDREYGDVPTGTISSASGGIVISGFIGGRYYFSDNFAAFAQLGYGISYLTLGISLKLAN